MGSQARCVFCSIVERQGPANTRVVWEDDDVVLFFPRSKDARGHLLCVPKRHIDQSIICSAERIASEQKLLSHMRQIGNRALALLLSNQNRTETKDSFTHFPDPEADSPLIPAGQAAAALLLHRPPFNSIRHLHLHCIVGPFTSRYSNFKFSLRVNSCLPVCMRWCVTLESLTPRL